MFGHISRGGSELRTPFRVDWKYLAISAPVKWLNLCESNHSTKVVSGFSILKSAVMSDLIQFIGGWLVI